MSQNQLLQLVGAPQSDDVPESKTEPTGIQQALQLVGKAKNHTVKSVDKKSESTPRRQSGNTTRGDSSSVNGTARQIAKRQPIRSVERKPNRNAKQYADTPSGIKASAAHLPPLVGSTFPEFVSLTPNDLRKYCQQLRVYGQDDVAGFVLSESYSKAWTAFKDANDTERKRAIFVVADEFLYCGIGPATQAKGFVTLRRVPPVVYRLLVNWLRDNEYFLACVCDTSSRNKYGMTLLSSLCAIPHNNSAWLVDQMEQFITHHTDSAVGVAHTRDSFGRLPLHFASHAGLVRIAKALFDTTAKQSGNHESKEDMLVIVDNAAPHSVHELYVLINKEIKKLKAKRRTKSALTKAVSVKTHAEMQKLCEKLITNVLTEDHTEWKRELGIATALCSPAVYSEVFVCPAAAKLHFHQFQDMKWIAHSACLLVQARETSSTTFKDLLQRCRVFWQHFKSCASRENDERLYASIAKQLCIVAAQQDIVGKLSMLNSVNAFIQAHDSVLDGSISDIMSVVLERLQISKPPSNFNRV